MADFIRIPGNPVPDGGKAIEFLGGDGVRLRAAIFPRAEARGAVVLMAGRCEFIEKYFEVVEDLRTRGFAVAAMDWRGQGLSTRSQAAEGRGHVGDFAEFRTDLKLFLERIVMAQLQGPYILATHSMGGAPALQTLADGEDRYRCAILCAPMTQLFDSAATRFLVGALAGIASGTGFAAKGIAGVKEGSLEFEGNPLTSDPRRHALFRDLQRERPDAALREPTYGWMKAASAAIADLHRPGRFSHLKTPTLIVSAGNDLLVKSSDHAWLATQSPLIEHVTIEGALHEIMMERDEIRDQYWRAFDGFIARHLGAEAPSGA